MTPFFRHRLRDLAIQGFDFICFTRIGRMPNSDKSNYDKKHSFPNARPRAPFRNTRKRCSCRNRNARPPNNGTGNNQMDRSTNYTACAFPLMQRCCMGAHTGPAGISSFHTVVTACFTAQQQCWRFATGYRKCDKQEKCGTSGPLPVTEKAHARRSCAQRSICACRVYSAVLARNFI